MPDWTLDNLAEATSGILTIGNQQASAVTPELTGFSIDTRTLKPGEVFVAIVGDRLDGHAFLTKAITAGAGALIVSSTASLPPGHTGPVITIPDTTAALQQLAHYHRKRHRGRFFGVTGSNGKTTTKEILRHLWTNDHPTWASSGNFNNHIGLPLNLIRIPLSASIAILEMGMNHSGEIRFLAEIAQPHAAVITNVGPAHIGNLGSLEQIALAKAEILENLPQNGWAVLEGDGEFFSTLSGKTQAQVCTFGYSPGCDILGSNRVEQPSGQSLLVTDSRSGDSCTVTIQLLGEHNARNTLAALALYLREGGNLKKGAERLRTLPPLQARMEAQESEGMSIILDCYNANPASMREAIRYLGTCQGRRVAVLGDMLELGEHSIRLHETIGEIASLAGLDLLVAIGAEAESVARGAKKAGLSPHLIHVSPSTDAAIPFLKKNLRPGDHVLLKASRGLHFEEIVHKIWPGLACDLH